MEYIYSIKSKKNYLFEGGYFIIVFCNFVLEMNLNDSYGKNRFYRK